MKAIIIIIIIIIWENDGTAMTGHWPTNRTTIANQDQGLAHKQRGHDVILTVRACT